MLNGAGNLIQNDPGPSSHFASFAIIAGSGDSDLADVAAYEIGGAYANAGKVALAVVSNGGFMTDGIGSGFRFDLLVAYTNSAGGTNIADIQLNQATADTTKGAAVEHAFDLVTLKGVALTSIVGSVLGSHDVIHFNGA